MFLIESNDLASYQKGEPVWEDEISIIEVIDNKPYFILEFEQRGLREKVWRFLSDDLNDFLSESQNENMRLSSVDMVFQLSNQYQIRRIKQVWRNPTDGSHLFVFVDGTMRGDERMHANFMCRGLALLKELPEVFADNA